MSIGRFNSDPQNLQLAIGFHRNNQLAQAEAIYKDIIRRQPRNFDALYLSGMLHAQQGDLETAAKLFGKAVHLKPDFIDAHYNHGVVLNALARHAAAITSYGHVLRLRPDHRDALQNHAGSLFELRRFQEALEAYDRALATKGDYAEALDNRGVVLRELARYEEALASHDRALVIAPHHAESWNNRGIALRALRRFEAAVESYDRAIAITPDFAEAYHNRGIALLELKRFVEALQSYDHAIALKPGYAEAHHNHGIALMELNRPAEALRSFDRAVEFKPAYAEAYSNRGLAWVKLNRPAEALQNYEHAIRLKSNHAEAYNNRGVLLNGLKRSDEALKDYEKAIRFKPDYAFAYYNRGLALSDLKRFDEALKSYDRALEIDPDYHFIHGTRLNAKMRICDWTDLENDISFVCGKVSRGDNASHPFPLLAATNAPQVQREAAEIWVHCKCPPSRRLPDLAARPPGSKIRLGYFSSDFHAHAVAQLIVGLLEQHDRSQFELIAFSFGRATEDEMRKRLRSAFDEFIDIGDMSDEEVCRLARSREIDIAIDLTGFTQDSRTGIFAMRAAPTQVNYLGYPGTMGAEYIDYLIADPTLIPASHRAYYTEKIVYLPNCYQPNDRRRAIADRVFLRGEMGLPETGFVFCCFNNNYKIIPDVFDSWMRILTQVDASVLWLIEDNAHAAMNLRKEAAFRGVNPDRLIFAGYIALPDHLARHRLADLLLDTLPYNAHTTASDALWAGLPLVTRIGETFAGRVAASLLRSVELPELVTTTAADFEALAVELARNPSKLAAIRQKLADKRLTAALFDTALFTRHIEAAYRAMHERRRANLPPDHIHVQA